MLQPPFRGGVLANWGRGAGAGIAWVRQEKRLSAVRAEMVEMIYCIVEDFWDLGFKSRRGMFGFWEDGMKERGLG